MKTNWKRNLYVSWLGCFLTGISISLVMPFMAFYIEKDLSMPAGTDVNLWSGLAISATALAAAVVAPIWGSLADRKGRKMMMIRAAIGMTFTMGGLAFVHSVWGLIALRLLNGLLSGYIPNATALIASQAPREKNGWALGTLATGAVSGNLIGPLLGGLLADLFGYRMVFIITGILLAITSFLTIFYVKEDFTPVLKKDAISTREVFHRLKSPQLLIGLFITTLIIQVVNTSISPVLPLFVKDLNPNVSNISFISGIIASLPGISALISSPIMGRLGDRIGNHKILVAGLTISLCCLVPMYFVQNTIQLGILRFLLGFSIGCLMPSVNSLISKNAPVEAVSRVFSYNQMFQNMGQVMGPLVGSTTASVLGRRSVFLVTGVFVLFNMLISSFNFKKNVKD